MGKAIQCGLLTAIFTLLLLPAVSNAAELTARDYGVLPSYSKMAISPSGERIAYRSTENGRDIAVIVSLKDKKKIAAVNLEEVTPRYFHFATEDELIMVASNVRRLWGFRGDLDLSTAYAYNLAKGEVRQLLTPGDVIYRGQTGLGRIVGISQDEKYLYMPAYVPESSTDQSPNFSLLRVELDSPRRPRVVFKGKDDTLDYFLDEKGEVLVHEIFDNRRNLHQVFSRQGDDWKEIYRHEGEVADISVVGLSPDRKSLVILANNSRTKRDDYFTMSLKDGEITYAGLGREDADIEQVYTDINRVVSGVRYSGFTPSYRFFDDALNKRLAEIQRLFPEHSVWLRDWSKASNGSWQDLLVYVEGSSNSGKYYRFPAEGQPSLLASARPKIGEEDINPVATFAFKARDGMRIPTLLTIPRYKVGEMENLPAVLMPHGGPGSYDHIGFDWMAQAFANRGYLVIQPQFRGSTGFGLEHYEAGHGEWGGKMQDDLTDALQVLVRKGMVDSGRVCIVGASYGGYAALAGGAFTPELYRCVVSINGVSDLRDMLRFEKREHGRDHWAVSFWENNIAKGEVSREKLEAMSPSQHAQNFKAPVLLIHGEHDQTVDIKQSKLMYKKLKRADKPVRFIRLNDETHHLLAGETRLQMVEAMVAFVDEHM